MTDAVAADQALGPVSRAVSRPIRCLRSRRAARIVSGKLRQPADVVGLPDLRGAFSLSFDEGAWLSTAGIGSQIFVAPAIAWLARSSACVACWASQACLCPDLAGIPFVHDYTTLIVASIVHGMLLGTFVPRR